MLARSSSLGQRMQEKEQCAATLPFRHRCCCCCCQDGSSRVGSAIFRMQVAEGCKGESVINGLTHLVNRPGQSQGLLYKHLQHSFNNPLIKRVIICENIFIAPSRPHKEVKMVLSVINETLLWIFFKDLNLKGHPN